MMDTNILLVDDDQDNCDSIADIFLDLGNTVNAAHDGPEALQLAGLYQYQLALLDFKMHGMNGMELCGHLKVSQPEIIVALVTAFASTTVTDGASSAGAQRIFAKPVDFEALMPFVRKFIVGHDA